LPDVKIALFPTVNVDEYGAVSEELFQRAVNQLPVFVFPVYESCACAAETISAMASQKSVRAFFMVLEEVRVLCGWTDPTG